MTRLPERVNRLVGRAMHAYNMLSGGDRVMVAVSGGVDSLVLVWLLDHWRRKAPICYEILAVHLDMGFGSGEHLLVREQLKRLGVPFLIEETAYGREALIAEDGKSGCYHCARQRRNRLFALAAEKGFTKIAFGHHKEDIIETFFLNMLYSGNLSTMTPRQELFDGRLAIIRPLAFLEKSQIRELGQTLGITPVVNPCPLSGESKRQEIRTLLEPLYAANPRIKSNIFHSMANVRPDYLLAAAQ